MTMCCQYVNLHLGTVTVSCMDLSYEAPWQLSKFNVSFNLLNLIYLLFMFSARNSRELKKNRGAHKSVFLSCWSHQTVLLPCSVSYRPAPSVKPNPSSSFALIQISSMRTWRWGQMVRVTRHRGLPPTRCSLPRVFVWETEEADGSLQRWDLFPPCF